MHSETKNMSVLVVADMAKRDRSRNFALFHGGTVRVLITTNLLSRSIDVPKVKLVVNFDAPINVKESFLDEKAYLTRIGRAGRFGKL